eukprot:3287127-Pyramimonas_sp.AAC.1
MQGPGAVLPHIRRLNCKALGFHCEASSIAKTLGDRFGWLERFVVGPFWLEIQAPCIVATLLPR